MVESIYALYIKEKVMDEKMFDFDPPQGQQDAISGVSTVISKIASLNARAVMPNGELLDRAQILEKLGLNPNTSPTAWLTVAVCGSNASALLPDDLQRVSATRIANASNVLNNLQNLSSGFARGGAAPG
jgi:hypothetical protein